MCNSDCAEYVGRSAGGQLGTWVRVTGSDPAAARLPAPRLDTSVRPVSTTTPHSDVSDVRYFSNVSDVSNVRASNYARDDNYVDDEKYVKIVFAEWRREI